MEDTEALHFSRLMPGRTVVGVRDENDRVAVAMLLDCAPEGGRFYEPKPAPSKGSGEWVLALIVGTPIALVFGGLLAVALTTH